MNVVIIGAGKTGRGYIAPIFYNNNYNIVFLDKDEELIKTLNKEKSYTVSYFDSTTKIAIDRFKAFNIKDDEAVKVLENADVVTTSVFANQIENLVPVLKKATKNRKKNNKLKIFCIENGINVKAPLILNNIQAEITEGIVFCTTIEGEDELDLVSESDIKLPIDGKPISDDISLKGIVIEDEFESLIQRKIFTYNFISAVIAYLGHYKGYKTYASAAEDKDIDRLLKKFLPVHNYLISLEYNISDQEQIEFSNMAVDKFRNPKIEDSILRNAIDVNRKLGKNERILSPLRMALKQKRDTTIYEIVIAAALHYGNNNENINIEEKLGYIENSINSNQVKERIASYLEKFQSDFLLEKILNL